MTTMTNSTTATTTMHPQLNIDYKMLSNIKGVDKK